MEAVMVEPGEITRLAGHDINSLFGLVISRKSGALQCTMSRYEDHVHPRTWSAFELIKEIANRVPASAQDQIAAQGDILMQADDKPLNVPSLGWQAKDGWRNVKLIPDLYYLEWQGYENFVPHLTPWDERATQVVWRGASTGLLDISLHTLPQLPRYQLCVAGRAIGPSVDAKLVSIVQGTSQEEERLIEAHLREQELFGQFLPMSEMHQYKFIVDIDGNANAWNFLARMRLGCCVLRVQSEWHQWFVNRFQPWKHYVPVKADLSDFAEKVEWCLANDAAAKAIAERSCALARTIRYESEMELAAQRFFAF